MISFSTLAERFSLKGKGLSDARVASVIKKENGFAVQFYVDSWSLESQLSDEWLNAVCWSSQFFGIFIMK